MAGEPGVEVVAAVVPVCTLCKRTSLSGIIHEVQQRASMIFVCSDCLRKPRGVSAFVPLQAERAWTQNA